MKFFKSSYKSVPKSKYFLELSNEEAEVAYIHDSYHTINLCRRVPFGFTSKVLTFEEWLTRYNIGIL